MRIGFPIGRSSIGEKYPLQMRTMKKLRVQFGNKLRDLRKQRGITQEQLAERASISVDFLSLVERGINAPSFETLEKLACALDVPVKQLFNFESSE